MYLDPSNSSDTIRCLSARDIDGGVHSLLSWQDKIQILSCLNPSPVQKRKEDVSDVTEICRKTEIPAPRVRFVLVGGRKGRREPQGCVCHQSRKGERWDRQS